MDLIESFELLKKGGFSVADYWIVNSEKDLKNVFPSVLKITEGHKTDVEGVYTDLNTMSEIKQAYKKLKQVNKRIIQQKQVKGTEIAVGIADDPTFGKTIMFGIGGIFVEVINDVSFRVCPITEKDSDEMIHEIKSKEILYGKRGIAVDISLLRKFLVSVSEFSEKFIINEMDLNPVIFTEKEYFIVDARIV